MESDLRHHEQTKSMQLSFFNQVKVLSNVIEDIANPLFIDDSNDILVLDIRDLADTVRNLVKTGQKQ